MQEPERNWLKPYVGIVATRFRMLLQYRAAAFAGFVTQVFWGSIKLMVLAAFYASAIEQPPLSFAAVVTYVWLGQILLGILPWNLDNEIQTLYTTGSVAYELLRPLDLYAYWFARTVAFRTAPTVLRFIPGVLFVTVVLPLIGLEDWSLKPPADLLHGALFLISLLGAVLLSCAITMLMHVSLHWTIEGRGIATLMTGVVPVFAGMVVPLPLFPNWAQPFLYWQPFRGLCDVPYRIYSGDIPVDAAVLELLMQFAWFGILVLFGMWIFGKARTKLVIQGG